MYKIYFNKKITDPKTDNIVKEYEFTMFHIYYIK